MGLCREKSPRAAPIVLALLILAALCGSNQLAHGTAEPAEPHYSMQPVTNDTSPPAQRGFLPVITHDKAVMPPASSKLIDSQDQMHASWLHTRVHASTLQW